MDDCRPKKKHLKVVGYHWVRHPIQGIRVWRWNGRDWNPKIEYYTVAEYYTVVEVTRDGWQYIGPAKLPKKYRKDK